MRVNAARAPKAKTFVQQGLVKYKLVAIPELENRAKRFICYFDHHDITRG